MCDRGCYKGAGLQGGALVGLGLSSLRGLRGQGRKYFILAMLLVCLRLLRLVFLSIYGIYYIYVVN